MRNRTSKADNRDETLIKIINAIEVRRKRRYTTEFIGLSFLKDMFIEFAQLENAISNEVNNILLEVDKMEKLFLGGSR